MDIERDIRLAKAGTENNLVYKTLTGLKSDLSGTIATPEILVPSDGSENNSDDESHSNSSEECDDSSSIFFFFYNLEHTYQLNYQICTCFF